MGLRDWLTGRDIMETRAQPEPSEQRSLANAQDWLVEALAGSAPASGQRVTAQKALGLSPVWAAVSIIAEQVGQLPLKVYRDLDETRVEARDHRAWRMLHAKPNDETPADRFWSAVTAQLLLWGNAFIEKGRAPVSGVVDSLHLLNPNHMSVRWDAGSKTKSFVYRNSSELEPSRRERIYTSDDLLHIFGLSLDGLIGESVISRCRNALGTALARDEFEGGFYNRGAVLSGIIEHPGKLGPQAAKNLKTSFSTIYSGSDKAHQTGILEEGATFKPATSPLRDLEFVSSQQLTRTDIAVMFKLPANSLGGSSGDSLTYATVEQNQVHFAIHAIAPWTNVIAKALSNDSGILPQSVHHVEFTLEAMLRSDSAGRATFYKTMHDIVDDDGRRAITVPEIRKRENLPALAAPPTPPDPTTNGSGTVPENALSLNGAG